MRPPSRPYARPVGGGPPLAVVDLVKRVARYPVINGVSLVVEPATVTVVTGASGAGKSLLLRLLLGLSRPASGEVRFGGRALFDHARPAMLVGAALSSDGGHPAMTGREHLAVVCRGAGAPATRAEEVCRWASLEPVIDQELRRWTGSWRCRLHLAAAMIADPALLVIDDAGEGMDDAGLRWLNCRVRQLAVDGRAVLMTSRAPSATLSVADRILSLEHGRLTAATDSDTGASA